MNGCVMNGLLNGPNGSKSSGVCWNRATVLILLVLVWKSCREIHFNFLPLKNRFNDPSLMKLLWLISKYSLNGHIFIDFWTYWKNNCSVRKVERLFYCCFLFKWSKLKMSNWESHAKWQKVKQTSRSASRGQNATVKCQILYDYPYCVGERLNSVGKLVCIHATSSIQSQEKLKKAAWEILIFKLWHQNHQKYD